MLTDAEIDGLSGRGESLLRERAVTVGKSGTDAIVACDSGDDATAVWAYLESLGGSQQTPTLAQHIDGLRMVWVQEHRPYGMSECFSANTLIGSWQVYRPMRSTAILWQSACHKAEPCDSIDDGKAKCIADYKSRVRAIFNQGE